MATESMDSANALGALQVIDNENRSNDFRFHDSSMQDLASVSLPELHVGVNLPGSPMRRIKILVSYDGSDYHGWQVQPGLATVQGVLEAVISRIDGRAVQVAGSGRTDAGVHAVGQVAAFSIENPIPVDNLRRAVNRLLPRDIRVLQADEAALEFHPRFQTRRKTYEYRIFRGEICSPFERRYVLHHPFPLDAEKMAALAPLLEGEHDFAAFASSDERDELELSKVRTIFCSRLAVEGAERLTYRVTGSGFLKHMVRNLVGVLLEVGKGNVDHAGILERLEPACKIPPGPTAAARGLFLMSVEY
jgi:tRNA pseudouridine38-40 synthase